MDHDWTLSCSVIALMQESFVDIAFRHDNPPFEMPSTFRCFHCTDSTALSTVAIQR